MRLQPSGRPRARGSAREVPRKPGRRPTRARRPARDLQGQDLLALIGHELRNPLGAIAAAAQVLQLDDPGAATAAEAHAVLARQTRVLGQLMTTLQDLGRARSGRIALNRRPLDLAGLVREACGALMHMSEGDADEAALQLDLEPAWVDGDAARLRQAMTCLMADALHARVDSQGVFVGLRLTPAGAVLQVRARAPATGLRPASRHAGVGELLARKLFEMHGARVQRDAAGVTVRLRAVAAPDHRPARARTLRVLLIENEAHSLDRVTAQLALEGDVVSTTSAAANGLEHLRAVNAPVCVVDLGAGLLGGFELARRARACGYAGRMIALTGADAADVECAAKAAGFDACVSMAEPAQLRRVLRES